MRRGTYTKVAKEIGEISSERVNDMGFDDISLAVAGFLLNNPNPSDDMFHKWADDEGIEHPIAEAAAYRLATMFVSFMLWGRANKEEVTREDVDGTELAMGISVEMEHAYSRDVAERIALDHLAEIPDAPLKYYTALILMEQFMKNLGKLKKVDADDKIQQFKNLVNGIEK